MKTTPPALPKWSLTEDGELVPEPGIRSYPSARRAQLHLLIAQANAAADLQAALIQCERQFALKCDATCMFAEDAEAITQARNALKSLSSP
jgi:hypothetical protein